MLKTALIVGTVLLGSLYIGFGDKVEFLPEEMKSGSLKARTTIVNFGGKLVPGWVTKTKDKRDGALEENWEEKPQPVEQ